MCFSCPPAGFLFCYACGATHQFTDPTPVQVPARRALTAPRASLSEMPDDLTCRILSFIPRFATVVGKVSHKLHSIMDIFPQFHVRAVFSQCSSENTLLGRYIQILAAHYEIDIQLMPHLNDTGTGPAQPLSDCNGILYRLSMNAHFLIVRTIRSLGVTHCPNTFFSPQEVLRFSEEAQRVQNVSLERVWSRLQLALPPPRAALPAVDAPAQEIRTWMHDHANRALLQRVTTLDLSGLGLTCVPKEIALCTALQQLNLGLNQLVSLPGGLFEGLTALQSLHLDNNRLVYLPAGLFAGLTALRNLDLDNNQLASLPARLFRGLAALQSLHLANNRFVSLPARCFEGLTALLILRLDYNQFDFLPVGLFEDLTALQELYLDHNQLVSVPAGLFERLTALRSLHLDSNRIVTLPPRLFEELTALQDLNLDNNRLVFLPAGLFDELTALQNLHLKNNRLASLPAGLSKGLYFRITHDF